MKKVHLLDKNRSYLFFKEINKYKQEITKQKNNPICSSLSTIGVAKIGANSMKKNGFRLVKVKIDV